MERAIANLKEANAMSPAAIRALHAEELAMLIYSSGFYNAKAAKLKALAQFLDDAYEDDIEAMQAENSAKLRRELLAVKGIGEETADAILLYALGKPSFVIDAYTRRLFNRLEITPEAENYSAYQQMFTGNLPSGTALSVDDPSHDTPLFSEYHALIVQHCKDACRKTPVCEGCCLRNICPTGQGMAKR